MHLLAMGQAMMQRLRTRAQFQAVMAAGVCARTPHFVLHRLVLEKTATAAEPATASLSGPDALLSQQTSQALFVLAGQPENTQPWLGPLVPKRWAKRSVTRHLLRRQIYAVGQEAAAQLPPNGAYVVRLRAAFDPKRFISASSEPLRQAVRSELQQLFGYAVRKLGTAPAAAPATAPDRPTTGAWA